MVAELLSPAISMVKRSKNRVYILELLSKTIGFLSLSKYETKGKGAKNVGDSGPNDVANRK